MWPFNTRKFSLHCINIVKFTQIGQKGPVVNFAATNYSLQLVKIIGPAGPAIVSFEVSNDGKHFNSIMHVSINDLSTPYSQVETAPGCAKYFQLKVIHIEPNTKIKAYGLAIR